MELAFSDEQLALRDTVRDLLSRECPPSVVRAAWHNDTGRADAAWRRLAEVDVLAVGAPEPGGLGLGMVDLVLALEEAGRAALPEPLVEHAAVSAPILGVIDGTATASAPGADLVPYAGSADVVVFVTDHGVHSVPRSEISPRPVPALDGSRRLFEVDWAPTSQTRHDVDPIGAFDRGALGTAAVLVGLSSHLLDVTVEYTTQRRQFGAPIGSFQAIKHHLANVAIALEFARPHVWRAAWSIDHHDAQASAHVSMAKAQASDAAELAARVALQCHGAIGYSDEYDLHLWMKRVWALAAAWGSAAEHRERVARAILDPPQGAADA